MAIANPVLTAQLTKLNKDINDAENKGDSYFLQTVLAPVLAFQRANKVVVDDQAFLQAVGAGGSRTIQVMGPIQVFNQRAVVECVVTVSDARGQKTHFHNVRLFVMHDGKWKLLGWANEQWVPEGWQPPA